MSSKKTPNKTQRKPLQERARHTVDAILTATTQILTREGLEKINTNRIAESAGVAIGSLYQYFGSKDQIMHVLVRKLLEQKVEGIRKNLSQSKSSNFEEAAHSLIRSLISDKVKNSKLEWMLEAQAAKLGITQEVEKFDAEVVSLLIQHFKPHLPHHSETDLEFSLYVLMQAIKGTLTFTNFSRPEYLSSKKFEKILIEMSFAALRP